MPGDELALVNRATSLGEKFYMAAGTRGWEPTHAMLIRMLQASGFAEIESLTKSEHDRRNLPPGATNSAYYRAACANPVLDPDALNRTYEARWSASSA